MKKKIVTLALMVALVAVAVVGATLAYFTDTQTATNTFTVGKVDIVLTEPGWTATGAAEADTVYAGEKLAKDPTVKNDGPNPCFVRIRVQGLNVLGTGDLLIRYRTGTNDADIGKLGDNWEDGGNGYFYYKGVLMPGITTDALFDYIVMPTALTNGDGKALTDPTAALKQIFVTAEAVQAQGALSSFSNVLLMDTAAEIRPWFTTCGLPEVTP